MARPKVIANRSPSGLNKGSLKRKKVIRGIDRIPSPEVGRTRASKSPRETETTSRIDPKFKSKDYQKLYNNNFGTRLIAYGRAVDFKSLDQNNAAFVRQWFKQQRLDKLLMEIEPIYPDLVRLFYSHFDKNNQEKGEIHTWVKGQHIVLDEQTLGKILDIPTTGLFDMPSRKWSTVEGFDVDKCIKLVMMDPDAVGPERPLVEQLPMPTRLLHLILYQTFICRIGRKSSMTYLDLLVMYCILDNVKVNMPKLIIGHMLASQKGRKEGSLPYGMWLTKVFRYFHVDLTNEAIAINTFRPLDSDTITGAIGFEFDSETGLWNKKGIQRAPRRQDPATRDQVKRPRLGEIEGKESAEVGLSSDQGNNYSRAALFQSLVVQEMLRRLHPHIFTPDEMENICDSAHIEMINQLNNCDRHNNSGIIIGDEEETDNGAADDIGNSGPAWKGRIGEGDDYQEDD